MGSVTSFECCILYIRMYVNFCHTFVDEQPCNSYKGFFFLFSGVSAISESVGHAAVPRPFRGHEGLSGTRLSSSPVQEIRHSSRTTTTIAANATEDQTRSRKSVLGNIQKSPDVPTASSLILLTLCNSQFILGKMDLICILSYGRKGLLQNL